MYENKEYRPSIEINLENGVYIFDSESATGKTYLCKQLKKLRAYGEPVNSFTYNDVLIGSVIGNNFENCKVIMLDRYDMYKELEHDLIKQHMSDCIILVDCKAGYIENIDSETCFINLTENNIEVSL